VAKQGQECAYSDGCRCVLVCADGGSNKPQDKSAELEAGGREGVLGRRGSFTQGRDGQGSCDLHTMLSSCCWQLKSTRALSSKSTQARDLSV
jgi:hypothetical protein